MKKSNVVKVVVPLVVMGGLGVALADKLSDFREAAGKDGCASHRCGGEIAPAGG